MRLCKDAACASVVAAAPAVDSWEQSLKVVIPTAGCGPPCHAEITAATGGAKTVVAVNAPDLWWGISGSPAHAGAKATDADRNTLSNEPLTLTVRAGDDIRVFGRSLAWTADGSSLGARWRPSPLHRRPPLAADLRSTTR